MKEPMKAVVYTQDGTQASQVDLPVEVFDVPWNADLAHQVLSVQQANQRHPTTHAKDRSERRGGGRKPWRQKGTGRARHGSTRSPIWRKGGVTHGPRSEKVLKRSVNQKMKRRALYALLSQKHRDGQVVFVDALTLNQPHTKGAKAALQALGEAAGVAEMADRKRNAAYVVAPAVDENTRLSFRNLGNVYLDEVRNMNPLDVARYKYIVIASPQEALNQFAPARIADKPASPAAA